MGIFAESRSFLASVILQTVLMLLFWLLSSGYISLIGLGPIIYDGQAAVNVPLQSIAGSKRAAADVSIPRERGRVTRSGNLGPSFSPLSLLLFHLLFFFFFFFVCVVGWKHRRRRRRLPSDEKKEVVIRSIFRVMDCNKTFASSPFFPSSFSAHSRDSSTQRLLIRDSRSLPGYKTSAAFRYCPPSAAARSQKTRATTLHSACFYGSI